MVKNSIALFSVEVLLRLLPEHAPVPWLFDFSIDYFMRLDKMPAERTANFPLFFIIQCSRGLGYELKGSYDKSTPYINLQEGAFTEDAPASTPFLDNEDTIQLSRLLPVSDFEDLKNIEMNAAMRLRLIDWYIAFLRQHTQHMGNIRSLSVLSAIMH